MLPKFKPGALAPRAAGAIAAVVALGLAPASAQNNTSAADAYQAGVDLGRTLHHSWECTGSGVYHEGCLDGIDESRFDREADQALDGSGSDAKPADPAPLLSPPSGMFHDPFSKPDESQPPNN
jgi:hypothetical protein